jgi:mono/diheme cytochrome c family protein
MKGGVHGFRAEIAGWRFILPILAALSLCLLLLRAGSAAEEITNPFLGQPEAIAAGRDIYGSKCYVCHHSAGARGPNLFATKLTDERFLEIVINGKQRTQMPAFGLRLSPDEVWQVHAFVKSTNHF